MSIKIKDPVSGYSHLTGVFLALAGTIIYARKKPNISKAVGFHELFHFFVPAGTLVHFYCVYRYIALPGG